MADGQHGGRGRVIAVLAGVGVLVAAVIAVAVLQSGPSEPDDGDDPTATAEEEGTRSFQGLPDEIPASVLPTDVTTEDVESTVVRSADTWTAVAEFTTRGDHEQLARAGDEPLRDEGFTLRQRAFDDTSMLVIYDHDDGSVLTVTYRGSTGGSDEVVRVSAVRTGP